MPAQHDIQPAVIENLVGKLQSQLPNLLAVYGFGSRVQGTATQESDLDMAVLVAGHADVVVLWHLAGELADIAGCTVDLLDLRVASTVMQHQIITTGVRWWALDAQAALFESAILSQKTVPNNARIGWLAGIEECTGILPDAVLVRYAATIERCVARAREEYFTDPATFARNFTRQDAAILNIQRACEAALDMGQHLIRRDRLGVPQGVRDVFALLAQAGRIETPLAEALQRMVGFSNIAVYDYQKLQLPITVAIIEKHLDEFLQYSKALLQGDAF